MQNELTALRPQLLETSDETERLMIKIEQDTIQVSNLTWIFCKDSREDSSQSHVGSIFIVLYFLKCKLDHF